MPKALQLTPMLRHYLEIKAEHPDAILLYRMGDFYEMFFEDAQRAAPILEVVLTARQKGTDSEAPMCGVPYHALGVYVAKLLRAGLRVAVCDQVEDPAKAKGLVKREVTRVITPGTVSDPGLLEGAEANYLASVFWDGDAGAGAFLDVSTGSFFVRRWRRPEEAVDDLALIRPREVLSVADRTPKAVIRWFETAAVSATTMPMEDWPDPRQATGLIQDLMGTSTLKGFGLDQDEPAVMAAAGALEYARETQRNELSHIRELKVGESTDHLILDAVTMTNLEVFHNLRDGRKKDSLLWVVDRTVTAPGGRLLRSWLRQPLRDPAAIEDRQQVVGELLGSASKRARLRDLLSDFGDPERVMARAVLARSTPREMGALRDGLLRVPLILAEIADLEAPLARQIAAVDPAADVASELERVLEAEPVNAVKEGGVIREGVDSELDTQRSLARDSRQHVLELEKKERKRTGITSLKIRFNKVFGYYLEVTKANQDLVPGDYIRKQTLVNSERYITADLKELEEQILAAEEQQIRLEETHFRRLESCVAESAARLAELAQSIARLDVMAGFAEVAARHRYVQPRVTAAGDPLSIREGRHPVVERMTDEPFVPNDSELDADEAQIVILTGPNMGGKSTYLRQTALLVLMAQIGSFIPAESATLGIVDRIFSRVGASDDLSRGESTFMVEMIETARILHQCTAESLVILDEVGRGTATFDGLSLAWAIVEHLHAHSRPKTLFATHYHELTELSALLPRVVNRTMAVKEWEDRIVFLRRVMPGSSDKSYGLHVARLAGIPAAVIDRASQILANMEAQEYDLSGKPRLARGASLAGDKPDQLTLFAPSEEIVASILREVDPERLSPLAALNLLHALKSRLDSD